MAEVEAEQALLRGNDLMAMIDQHAPHPVDRSSRSRRRNTTRGAGRPSPVHRAVITDPKRLARVLKGKAGAIYPGEYATCVFDVRKALCLNSTPTRAQFRSSITVNRSPARTSRSRSATSRN